MARYKVQIENQVQAEIVHAEKMEVMWGDQEGSVWLQLEDEEGNVAGVFPLNNMVSAVRVAE